MNEAQWQTAKAVVALTTATKAAKDRLCLELATDLVSDVHKVRCEMYLLRTDTINFLLLLRRNNGN